MKVLMISSEISPFSRTGMLGDAVSGLSKGLVYNGVECCVLSPMYLSIDTAKYNFIHDGNVSVMLSGKEYAFDIFTTEFNGVRHIFMKNDELFGRRNIYGAGDFDYSDNDIRFGVFCLASLEYVRKNSLKPDVIHCHEWSTGLIPVYRNLFYEDIKARILFTAHDISYQGIFSKFSIQNLGLPWKVYNIEELEYYEGISLLKGGMVHSDHITVPSMTYAKDIQTEEYSQGLGLLLSDMSGKLTGILGGIDFDAFNPLNDPFIPQMYCAENIEAKAKNKAAFLQEAKLKGEDKPLFIVETKFTERKGLELIAQSAAELSQLDANFAFFGYGESHLCAKFKELAATYENMTTYIGYNEKLIHMGYAAADFVLRPSLYEPSGNSHLKGLRYGALPVVSRTGGHIDSVSDIDDNGCGFFIENYSRQAMQDAINRAVDFYKNKPILDECMKKAMQIDFSWKTASKQYIELYGRLTGGGYES